MCFWLNTTDPLHNEFKFTVSDPLVERVVKLVQGAQENDFLISVPSACKEKVYAIFMLTECSCFSRPIEWSVLGELADPNSLYTTTSGRQSGFSLSLLLHATGLMLLIPLV